MPFSPRIGRAISHLSDALNSVESTPKTLRIHELSATRDADFSESPTTRRSLLYAFNQHPVPSPGTTPHSPMIGYYCSTAIDSCRLHEGNWIINLGRKTLFPILSYCWLHALCARLIRIGLHPWFSLSIHPQRRSIVRTRARIIAHYCRCWL